MHISIFTCICVCMCKCTFVFKGWKYMCIEACFTCARIAVYDIGVFIHMCIYIYVGVCKQVCMGPQLIAHC